MDDPPQNGQTPAAVAKLVEDLTSDIFRCRPIFGEIMKKHGAKSLYEYSKDFLDVNTHQLLETRRSVCIEIVKKELAKRLPKTIVKKVEKQLLKRALVSTTDHHSMIGHPFWLNANIISALPYEQVKDETLKYLIVFSFASVSNNNASGFPRGLLFHGGEEGEGQLIRLPILPDKWKMRTVYGTPAYTKRDLERAESLLKEKYREGIIGEKRTAQILELFNNVLADKSILNSEDLCEQITKLNLTLWPKFFAGSGMPDLIYLEAETITREIYLKEVFKKPSCLLARMLIDEETRRRVMQYFGDIPGAFSEKQDYGTYFFWGRDEKGHRVRLILDQENNQLASKDNKIVIPLTLENIASALTTKTIFPSAMAVYLTLALHFGMKCLGGFSQVHDLTKMKEALLHLLTDIGRFREIHAVSRIQTKELGGDGLTLSYIENAKGELTPAMGIDLLLSPQKLSYEHYVWMARHVTLREMMGPLLPEIYTVLFHSYERDPKYQSLTPESIMEVLGLQERLRELNANARHELSPPSSKILT